MKKTGTCPKCSSTQVYPLRKESWMTKIYQTEPSEILRYACLDCGYVETYLADQNELAKLKKKLGG
jgi:predicted nucleic-acid-binding Zn-ribbon protein